MNLATMRRAIWCVAVVLATVGPAMAETATGRLSWDPSTGAVLETPSATVWLDRNEQLPAPDLLFTPDGGRQVLDHPTTTEVSPTCLKLTYRVTAPGGVTMEVHADNHRVGARVPRRGGGNLHVSPCAVPGRGLWRSGGRSRSFPSSRADGRS